MDVTRKKLIFIIIVLCLCLLVGQIIYNNGTPNKMISKINTEVEKEIESETHTGSLPTITDIFQQTETNRFSRFWLQTDSSIHGIPLEEVLNWWPGKDWIPAIHDPDFISIDEASDKSYVIPESLGISIEEWSSAKFYPYSIMNWHEIVTDIINNVPVSVTFCPLCWSAIVFDRRVEWAEWTWSDKNETLTFWVSWMLRESNMLMYDTKTETLRSQALGKWVVWAYTDTQLDRISSDVISFEQFVTTYPDGKVLSDETGYAREYTHSPYGDYDVNDRLYFPVSNEDASLPKKEMLYVINDEETSIAFVKATLLEVWEKKITVDGVTYTATVDQGRITVTRQDWTIIPGYHEMWFSWVTHNPNSKNIVQ